MRLFDRYRNSVSSSLDIFGKVDFGRYVLIEGKDKPRELTGKETEMQREVCADLLDSPTDCDFFLKTHDDVEAGTIPPPVIRNVSGRLKLTDFELLLQEHLFHIENAFKKPHELLKRELEKVNVASARKIPPKSYEHMAGHTEDWEHSSVFSFKPWKVIHEELEVDHDLYENRALLSFVERCLRYLDIRLNETSRLEDFFERLKVLEQDKMLETMWFQKRERNLYLIGFTYKESDQTANKLLRETQTAISDMRGRLARLRDEKLFKLVGKGRVHTPELRATNVLVNHKHYRYLRQLWPEMSKVQPEPTEQEKLEQTQRIHRGLVDFALSIYHYCLKEHLGFTIKTSSSRAITATHSRMVFGTVSVNVTEKQVIVLEFGTEKLEFVVIGNPPQNWAETGAILDENPNRYVLYLDLDRTTEPTGSHPRILPISPYDVDSTERVAGLIRGIMLRLFYENLNQERDNKFHILKDYLKAIHLPSFIRFDESRYKKFRFTGLPEQHDVNFGDWRKRVQGDARFLKNGRPVQDKILTALEEFRTTVTRELGALKDQRLFCFNMHCDKSLDPKADNTENFDYIRCNSCQSVVEQKGNKLSFRIEAEKYKDLRAEDWGCDRIAVLPQPNVIG